MSHFFIGTSLLQHRETFVRSLFRKPKACQRISCIALFVRKQFSQENPALRFPVVSDLHPCEFFFKRPHAPALLGRKRFQGFPLIVEGADVSHFNGAAVGHFFNPAQGKTLGAANVGTVIVNPAFPGFIKKGTCAFRMGFSMQKEVSVMVCDVSCLDFKDTQCINTAIVTSGSAVKTIRVHLTDRMYIMIDALVKALKILHWVFLSSP